eukprot:2035144-Rhodomonas_salina.1
MLPRRSTSTFGPLPVFMSEYSLPTKLHIATAQQPPEDMPHLTVREHRRTTRGETDLCPGPQLSRTRAD